MELIEKLNQLGGANGVGLVDMVENRLVGMKSRGVYETPGGTILYRAHEALETLCLDRDTQHYKEVVAPALRSWCTSASGLRRCARRCPPLWIRRRNM